jgi:hypothetical protein
MQVRNHDMQPTNSKTSADLLSQRQNPVSQAKGWLANAVRVSQPATDFLAAIAEHDQQSKK